MPYRFFGLLLVLMSFFLSGCQTQSVKKVHITEKNIVKEMVDISWAGFAFLGDFNQRETRYPYTAKIISSAENNGQRSIIDSQLSVFIKGFQSDAYNLKTEKLTKSNKMSMALGITYEDVYELDIDGKYKVSYEIGLNVVLFDFEDKKIISVFPMRFLHNELYKVKPNDADHARVINNLYTGHEFNILKESLNRMQSLNIRESYGNYIGVRNVALTGNSKEIVPKKFIKGGVIHSQIAQEFEGLLSKNSFVPVVPYTKGELIGRSMVARFSDRSKLNLKLPELDYYIDIDLRGFGFKQKKEHNGYTGRITVKSSTELSPNITDLKLSKQLWVLEKASGDIENKESQWIIYKDVLSRLINDFTKQLATSDSNWTKKHSVNKDAKEQMESLRILIKKSQ
ncbi:hypothetical protein N9351_02360 [Candidatus Thioglobus sp.]|nr:hypothetical protein [Candidatus Thioglobus sp.]